MAKWKCSNSLRTYLSCIGFTGEIGKIKFGSNQVSSFDKIEWFYEVANIPHSQDINFLVIFF